MPRRKKPKGKIPFRRVEVEWADAYSIDEWTPVEAIQARLDKPFEHPERTGPYLVAENAEWVAVSNSVTYNEDSKEWGGACTMVIPKGMVKVVHDG